MSGTEETAIEIRPFHVDWAEQAYPNLIYFHEADKGGHFAARKSRSSSPPTCEPHSGRFAR